MGESKHCFRGWILTGVSLIYCVALSLYSSEFMYGLSRFGHVRLFVTPWTIPPPGFSVREVLQAGILDELSCPPPQDLLHPGTEPISLTYPVLEGRFFTAPPGKPMPPSLKVKVKSLSRVWLCHPMDGSLPGSGSLGFSRQEYWSGLPFPSPGDLPNPGIEPGSPALQTDALPSEPYL